MAFNNYKKSTNGTPLLFILLVVAINIFIGCTKQKDSTVSSIKIKDLDMKKDSKRITIIGIAQTNKGYRLVTNRV